MEATRIIAVRHGETAWNVETRIQGQLDIALNAKGAWQAKRLAQALTEEPIDHIYSSDLSRAHATARAVAEGKAGTCAANVQLDAGLRERCFGSFEGHTWADIETQWPEESRRWRQRDPDFAPPGGETPRQIQARVQNAINTIAARHTGQLILLVAHGGVLDMLYRLATNQELHAPRTWELGNASINRLLWTPQSLTLVGWSDSRHLQDDALDESSA